MASLIQPIVPKNDVPEIGQHFVECGTEDCNKNCQFYCNPCHRPMCEQCRDEHLRSEDTKTHEVVLYRQRIRQLPVEKCKDHPTKDIDMLCEKCQVLVCSKCATQNHRGHLLTDLEEIYSERFTQCIEKIYKVHKFFLPTTQEIQNEIKQDATQIKTILEDIRKSMKAEAEKLKSLVDEIVSSNLEQVDKIEDFMMQMLQSEDKTYNEYISYLNDMVKELNDHLSSTETLKLITANNPETKPIPTSTKPVLPVFILGQYSRDDVAKHLGKVTIPATKPENRKIKSSEAVSFKPVEKQTKQGGGKSDGNKAPSLSSSVTKVKEYSVPGVGSACHISLEKSGKLWVSDLWANLVEIDLQGNLLQNIRISFLGDNNGYHTVTRDGVLVYKDLNKRVINRISKDNKITKFIKTGGWKPLSIYSSHISGDILVGMKKNEKAKITRYDEKGNETQTIQRDSKEDALYHYPHYITENFNGDICASDIDKQAVVVVNKSGHHMFSYTGQKKEFHPYGICTDILGHILVCDFDKRASCNSVHLLYQDGQFLCFILTKQQGVDNPSSICVDEENNLYVGHRDTNTVSV